MTCRHKKSFITHLLQRKEYLMIVSIFWGSHVDVWHDCNEIDTDFQHMSENE